MKRLRIAVYLLASVITWTTVSLGLWSVVPMAFGLQPTVVVSGSMSPAIDAGDVVFVDPDPTQALLVPGSIITYADPAVDGLITTHRIIEVNESAQSFVTKGDANPSVDSTAIPTAAVQGSARFLVPSSGLLRLWYANGNYLLVVLATAGVAASAYVTLGTNPFDRQDGALPAVDRPAPTL